MCSPRRERDLNTRTKFFPFPKPLEMLNSNATKPISLLRKDEKNKPITQMSHAAYHPDLLLSVDTSVPHLDNNDTTATPVKSRSRSISPHARAILRRTFSRSRSRSRSRHIQDEDDASSVSSSSSSQSSYSSSSKGSGKQMLVAVTSCRSDAYYAQKAPGAISMLPRKAPSALKVFHELAVGMKDAYEAVGATPVKISETSAEWMSMSKLEQEGRIVLLEFIGNVNFVSNVHFPSNISSLSGTTF